MPFRHETKIFDPADGFGVIRNLAEITDATIAKRAGQWWMYAAGQLASDPGVHLFSLSLPEGAPLSATGWNFTTEPDDSTRAAILDQPESRASWHRGGGRHCPSYVRGWDPRRGEWVERVYYAGAADNLWGPYAISYLEWDGRQWVDQAEPVFAADQDWERGSVYEPNLIYADGKWKMWYVAGSNQQDYLVQGFAESSDGRSDWSAHKIFLPPEEKVFDFCVIPGKQGYEAVYSRVWVANSPAPETTGLWWCHAKTPASEISRWSEPVQIMTAENCGWHSGPWKPSARYDETNSGRLFVFFDGIYNTGQAGGFPFAFTLGCLELDRPGA
ncbi:MAG TPA: hypothetical protein VKU19_41565 [Bryobacteraceae bacterium]|nr:hypothetical protein [Bryobacteraceae bacterium]